MPPSIPSLNPNTASSVINGEDQLAAPALLNTLNSPISALSQIRSAQSGGKATEARVRSAYVSYTKSSTQNSQKSNIENLCDTPDELLLEIIDLLDTSSLVKASEINQQFKELTASRRDAARDAQYLIHRANNLDLLRYSNAHPATEEPDTNPQPATTFPRLNEFHTIIERANDIVFSKYKAMVLAQLAKHFLKLTQGQMPSEVLNKQCAFAFIHLLDVSASIDSQYKVSLLNSLIETIPYLPTDQLQLYAIACILRMTEKMLDQQSALILAKLAHNIWGLEDQNQINALHAISETMATLSVHSKIFVLTSLVQSIENFPEGQLRLDAMNSVLSIIGNMPADKNKSKALGSLVEDERAIRSLDEDQRKTIFNWVLRQSAHFSESIQDEKSVLINLAYRAFDLPTNEQIPAIGSTLDTAMANTLNENKTNTFIHFNEKLALYLYTMPEQDAVSMEQKIAVFHAMLRYVAIYAASDEDKATVLVALIDIATYMSDDQSLIELLNAIEVETRHISSDQDKARVLIDLIMIAKNKLRDQSYAKLLNTIRHAAAEMDEAHQDYVYYLLEE